MIKIIDYLDVVCNRIKYLTKNGIGVSFAGERTPGFDFALDEDYDAFRHYEVGGSSSLKMRLGGGNGAEISDSILMLHRTVVDAKSHEEALAISLFRGYFKNMYFPHSKGDSVSHSGAYSKRDATNNVLCPVKNIAAINHVRFSEKGFINMMQTALIECRGHSHLFVNNEKEAYQIWEMIWDERDKWPMSWKKYYEKFEKKCINAIPINTADKVLGLTAFQLSSVSNFVMQLVMFNNEESEIEYLLSAVKEEWEPYIEREKLMINNVKLGGGGKNVNAL
jgi:hypothetical protein